MRKMYFCKLNTNEILDFTFNQPYLARLPSLGVTRGSCCSSQLQDRTVWSASLTALSERTAALLYSLCIWYLIWYLLVMTIYLINNSMNLHNIIVFCSSLLRITIEGLETY